MPVLTCLFVLAAQWQSRVTRGQDDPERELARRSFERGVLAAESKDWERAADQFEESLRHAEHPAARFNLVLASDELQRNLEVVRHALAFLDLPQTESRPEARAQVDEILQRATRGLAVLDAEEVSGAELRVDGQPAQVRHGALIYLLPGPHVLETRRAGEGVHKTELSLAAGETRSWPAPPERVEMVARSPVSLEPAAQAPAAPREPETALETLRSRAAWSVAGVAAVSGVTAVALYATAKLLGEDLQREGAEAPGYPQDADRYGRLKQAIAPLALSSGVLMAVAIALGPRVTDGRSLGWGVAALVSGAAMVSLAGVWLAHEPRPLVQGTPIEGLELQAGTLWLGVSLPLIAYGVTLVIAHARHRPLTAHAQLPLTMTW